MRFQSGDLEAFSEIMAQYWDKVYEIAYGIIHNSEDAYDISQEVFIKVYKSLDSLKNLPSFDTWLHKVTANTCLDFMRRQTKYLVINDVSLIDQYHRDAPIETLVDTSSDHKLLDVINEAVEDLPQRQRIVFILRYYEELSLKEIAKKLGCSIGTVKAHLFRATRQIRNLLSPLLMNRSLRRYGVRGI